MKSLSKAEKQKIISRLFWDTNINIPDPEKFIEHKLQNLQDIQSQQFFRNLLTSCDWYTLLKLMQPDKLQAVLDDVVIEKLFSKDLKRKYCYARNVLSRKIQSAYRYNSLSTPF